MALRSTLGASRRRIVWQVLTESLILALLGGTLGLLLAYWGLNALQSISPYTQGSRIPGYERIGLNATVLGFTGILSVLTALGFGLVPAFQSSTLKLSQALKTGTHQISVGTGRHGLLNTLVVAQVTLALILLTGAFLLIRSFHMLYHTQPGFDPSHILTVQLELPHTPHNEDKRNRAAIYNQMANRLGALPSVEAAGAINIHTLTPFSADTGFQIDGQYTGAAEYRMITVDYFKALQIPLIQGRTFLAMDDQTNKRIVIVNQEFVRRYFQGKNPLGIKIGYHGSEKEIVGVVGNVKRDSMRAMQHEPFMYEPIHQDSWSCITFLLRTTGDPMALADSVRSTIWAIDPDQPILRIEPMRQIVGDSISVERFCTILLSLMAGMALLIAVVGIYGMMAFAVNERTNEIGIRLALGAQQSDILTLITKKGLILAIIGLGVGLVGALALTRYMSSMLYEISATDPATFVFVPLLLFSVAMLACCLPARRATKIDPMEALRYE
jgi:putative ABC transport system permease protein